MAECEIGEGTLTAAIVTQSSYALGANAKPFSVVICIKLDKAVNVRPDNITQTQQGKSMRPNTIELE
jgi:hypothetical protein